MGDITGDTRIYVNFKKCVSVKVPLMALIFLRGEVGGLVCFCF